MKKTFLILITVCGMLLTGCGSLTDLTDNQSNELAEYMAGSVLRYTDNYTESLIYPTDIPEESDSTANGTDATNTNTNGTVIDNTNSGENSNTTGNLSGSAAINGEPTSSATPVAVNLTDLFNTISNEDYKVKYSGYELYDSYPEDSSYFSLHHSDGSQLLTVSFKITNTSDKSISVNMVKSNIVYFLSDTANMTYKPMLTLLDNDIQSFNSEIKKGKSKKVVLVFEVSNSLDLTGIDLHVGLDGQEAVIALKE